MSVEREQPAGVRVLGRLRRARVRDDPRHQRAQLVDLGEDRQGVAVALGHLAAVEPRDGGDPPVDQDLGRDQHRSVDRVERRRDLARDLHVLLLVTPHRHDLGAEHQDVGRHPLAGMAGEHPGQLEHLGKVRLAVQGHAQRVDPEREPGGGQLVGVAPHRPAITLRGQRVRVRDEAEDVVAAGQGQRRPDHAEVVAEMRPAARLDAVTATGRRASGARAGAGAWIGVACTGGSFSTSTWSGDESAASSRGGRSSCGCAWLLAAYEGDHHQRADPDVRMGRR